jgi:hypothetical protein
VGLSQALSIYKPSTLFFSQKEKKDAPGMGLLELIFQAPAASASTGGR